MIRRGDERAGVVMGPPPDALLAQVLLVTIPFHLPSAANLREHWRARTARVNAQRQLVRLHVGRRIEGRVPCLVTMTRLAERELDDDNLHGAFKAIRDEIAVCLGLRSDRDPRVSWRPLQRRAPRGQSAIEILVQVVS